MNLIYLLFLLFSCNCSHNGTISMVAFNKELGAYQQTNIDLGEEILSISFNSCEKKKGVLYLVGKIDDRNSLYGNSEDLEPQVTIELCDRNGHVIEELGGAKANGVFSINVQKDKKKFLVFRKINSDKGVRIDLRSFS